MNDGDTSEEEEMENLEAATAKVAEIASAISEVPPKSTKPAPAASVPTLVSTQSDASNASTICIEEQESVNGEQAGVQDPSESSTLPEVTLYGDSDGENSSVQKKRKLVEEDPAETSVKQMRTTAKVGI